MARLLLPPLRDRAEDLFTLAVALAARARAALTAGDAEVEAVERLMLEPWPGNARELDAALAAVRRLDPKPGLRTWAVDETLGTRTAPGAPPLTREVVEEAITQAGGNVSAAAAKLGVSRGKLLRLRKRG